MNDRLSVFFDPCVLQHDTGEGFFEASASPYLGVVETHPENAERARNMLDILQKGPLAPMLDWHRGDPASRAELQRFHVDRYLDELAAIPEDETRWFSGTTVFGPGSYRICCAAAGQSIAAARQVFESGSGLAYALLRPPGHHAQPDMADGYCFFNNIGVAIEALRAAGLKRAAVIDWDVHHGNGTQAGYYEDPDILTVSLHMNHGAWGDTHPQTGAIEEAGSGAGLGTNLNIPMPYGAGDRAYCQVFDEIVMPAVRDHAPEILFIANGQDANQFDPNGRQLLSMAGFYELGRRVRMLSKECCEDRLVLVQEGGYAVSYAAYCLHAVLAGVLGSDQALDDPLAYMQEDTDAFSDFVVNWQRRFQAATNS